MTAKITGMPDEEEIFPLIWMEAAIPKRSVTTTTRKSINLRRLRALFLYGDAFSVIESPFEPDAVIGKNGYSRAAFSGSLLGTKTFLFVQQL
jgi:hypothetical protein